MPPTRRPYDDPDLSPTSPIEETDTGHSETEVLPDPDLGPELVPGVDAPVRCEYQDVCVSAT